MSMVFLVCGGRGPGWSALYKPPLLLYAKPSWCSETEGGRGKGQRCHSLLGQVVVPPLLLLLWLTWAARWGPPCALQGYTVPPAGTAPAVGLPMWLLLRSPLSQPSALTHSPTSWALYRAGGHWVRNWQESMSSATSRTLSRPSQVCASLPPLTAVPSSFQTSHLLSSAGGRSASQGLRRQEPGRELPAPQSCRHPTVMGDSVLGPLTCLWRE